MVTIESLRRKIESAAELGQVVSTMKAMAALNIGQYEQAVHSLKEYYNTVALGITAYLRRNKAFMMPESAEAQTHVAIVFGSDQGLVGSFNHQLVQFAEAKLKLLPGTIQVWTIGERTNVGLADAGLDIRKTFAVPGSLDGVTPLIGKLILEIETEREREETVEFWIIHNRSHSGLHYEPTQHRLFPLDDKWQQEFQHTNWPTNNLPNIAGNPDVTLLALIREYLFVSLYQSCIESLASENESRLASMQRAEKNIEELLDELRNTYHQFRQNSIDEELFDVVSGFEALK
ncbi:MAG: F0F1 ATP synthase subunit gamma [Bacteroidetes bacterium]|nr:F0F1 ATP synthase subunit gamma [Bacteroidota bacterium]